MIPAITDQKRYNKFCPNGVPTNVRCYDAGDSVADRYTVVFSGRYRKRTDGQFIHLGMSAYPFHPMGMGCHGESLTPIDTNNGWTIPVGRKNHLGKRIEFTELPDDCKAFVLDNYFPIWGI